MDVANYIALTALCISIVSLCLSLFFWNRSFRPIVTAMVKTSDSGNRGIFYDLEILNSGIIPAKNITLKVDLTSLENHLGKDAGDDNKDRWFSCFNNDNIIKLLHQNAPIVCSFGYSAPSDTGFWKYRSVFFVVIEYEGFFGKKYATVVELQIQDSTSFTGYHWRA